MNNLINTFYDHVSEIIIAVSGALAWLFERNKRKTEQQAAKATADHTVMDLYQDALNDLKTRYDEKFAELEKEIKSLRTNLEYWKTKYKNLKLAFDEAQAKNKK